MKPVTLDIESYLFESENGPFRAVPFYELSTDEWVIYQNEQPQYLIDFNLRESSFIKQVKESMDQGFDLEEIIYKYGVYLGLDWTTKHNIKSQEIENSQQTEKVELEVIESFEDVANELIFIATDDYKKSNIIDEEELFEQYMVEDENGYYGLESVLVDRKENIKNLIDFIFQTNFELTKIQQSENISICHLTSLIGQNINLKTLEEKYQDWLSLSDRNNSMDEYGSLLGLIGYLERNADKKQLILRIENKLLCPTMHKSNGGESAKSEDKTKNKSRSWLKRLWS
tara:strand:- start:649 stop:1503 length:855 start_codon:yes stop_codon:yes gene_type:complete